MRSIRLSLIVYFLVLLAAALGAVSFFAYQTTRQTLLDKQATGRALLCEQHEHRSQEVNEKLDRELLAQAYALGSMAQAQFEWSRGRVQEFFPLGLLTAVASPNGHLLAPLWVAEGVPGNPVGNRVHAILISQIRFTEDLLSRDTDILGTEYSQIDSEWGITWRSQSMRGRSFPLNAQVFSASTPFFEHRFDNASLAGGPQLRRVSLKVPVARTLHVWEFSRNHGRHPPRPEPPKSERGRTAEGGRRQKGEGDKRERPRPPSVREFSRAFFIQVASETDRRDALLAEHRAQLDASLATLEEESEATLCTLSRRLLLISALTFAAVVAGGCYLVYFGLAPLRRLSDAVSRVSARDFRLPFDEPRLPAELRPIVGRLNETLDLLKRAFAREKQAAADISHELRTPLASLMTTIEVALRKPRQPEQYREVLADCHAAGKQMTQLVERLLALARLDAGVDTLRPQQIDAADLARQCAGLVRPLAEARGLTLDLSCDEPAWLKADPAKLREVVTNLLHNAIQYNRPHGRIDLEVGRENGHVRLEVRDTGIGISPENCEHIFERFYRADPSRHSEGLHAGLGLAIVKGYVDLMGGTVSVESREGEGTRFRVHLPAES